jgi:hypothetical protein
MRKAVFSFVALMAAIVAMGSTQKAEAGEGCYWYCIDSTLYCSCPTCPGRPPIACLVEE